MLSINIQCNVLLFIFEELNNIAIKKRGRGGGG